MKPISSGLDPLNWARYPRSRHAFSAIMDLVKSGDGRFVEILDDLKKQGRTDGQKLLQVWTGNDWTAA